MIRMLFTAVFCFVAVVALLVAATALIGTAVDRKGERDVERDRCLQEATNGLEIKRCR